MTFLDTGILVGVLLERHPEHAVCLAALENSKPETAVHRTHALTETFATLTGFDKLTVVAASELTLG